MKKLYELTVKEASEGLRKRKFTSTELVKSCLDRIEEKEPEINAFITVTKESALEKAEVLDQKIADGEEISKIAGIPYSLKDVYLTKGIKTTAGSKILEDYIAQYDSTVYDRLEDAGAILIGKTNCDPFGFGSSTEHSAYGTTKNPIDTKHVPGGSSGGSGAAVAYGGGLFSIGEDTGGSIRCPAAFCGITGLKPTYGRVSRYGSIAYASSYDTVGPMAKTPEGCAIVLEAIAGKDEKDATTQPDDPTEYSAEINKDISGKKIGIPKEYFGKGTDKEVLAKIEDAKDKFKDLGCEMIDLSLPLTKYAVATYYVIGLSEASSNLARYDGIRYGHKAEDSSWDEYISKVRGEAFSDEAKRRIMIGTYALSAGYADKFYKKAQKLRQLLKRDFAQAFEKVDIMLTPTMPVLPFKFGENVDDPLKMWLLDALTVSINPVGVPALSVPAGMSDSGLPVGMQLIGPHLSEASLFNFAHKFLNS